MSRNLSSPPEGSESSRSKLPAVATVPAGQPAASSVVAINDDGAFYLALAQEIQGAAVGLSPDGQRLLRRGLVERFGELFAGRGDEAVDELLRLANAPRAA